VIAVSPGSPNRALSLPYILLIAFAVHGPLLLMQLPSGSYDAYVHMFFANHYAQHWFDPWNTQWFAGFSQTTYPPLAHQLIALFSFVMGLQLAYMFVQLIAVLLLTVGIYRFAGLWVDETAASYAALGSVFLGSLAMLVYQSGQLNTTLGAAITVNAIPYFYRWLREARIADLVKAFLITVSAAAVHHLTLITIVLFSFPVIWLALVDREDQTRGTEASLGGILTRAVVFGILAGAGIAAVLLPFWIAFFKNPVTQLPIPHPSRSNYLLDLHNGLNFWIIPYGAMILAIPFIFFRGSRDRRLQPLFLSWWVTTLIGLGGTTPVAHLLFGRLYYVFTYERFTFISTCIALPFVGLLAETLISRFRMKAVIGLAFAAAATFAMGVAWITFYPIAVTPFDTRPISDFLNRDDHMKFRYVTLGFGSLFDKVSIDSKAATVDGDYNSARLLPEMTSYGAAKLDSAKYFGVAGMESLRAVLKHANQYGLKYIFVRDRYYEPLLAFAGWRPAETYNGGLVTLWVKDDVPPAQPMDFGTKPAPWEGLLWGFAPMSVAVLALLAVFLLPERRRASVPIEFPASDVVLREAR
jgi:hypothetical protein